MTSAKKIEADEALVEMLSGRMLPFKLVERISAITFEKTLDSHKTWTFF